MPTDELDEDFEEELAPDLDEEELDEDVLADDELEDDEFGEETLDDETLETEDDAEAGDAEAAATPTKRKKAAEEDDDDDELDPDDVEADLDTILKDRIAAADDLEDEEDEEEEEDSGESTGRVQPKTDSEFVCKSCFLVKRVSQRVPGTDDLCNDCV
jgi:hypothetical protein